MKKRIALLITLIAILILPLAVEAGGFAQEVVTLGADKTVDRDVFATGELVEILGTVNGDVYAAAGIVIIEGTVNGDVLAAGGEVWISGSVSDDVRAVGGELTIDGSVGRNVTLIGGELDIPKDGLVAGSAVLAGGDVFISGAVSGRVKAAADTLTLDGEVGDEISAHVERVRLTENASLLGGMTYFSPSEAVVSELAQVQGELQQKDPLFDVQGSMDKISERLQELWLMLKLAGFISFLVLGLILVGVYPRFSHGLAQGLRQRPGFSLGLGVAIFIATPIVALILMATLVGVPIGLLILFIYLLSLYLAKLPVVILLGELITGRAKKRKIHIAWTLLLGTIIYYLLTLIPVIGHILGLIMTIFGLGAMALTKGKLIKVLRDKELV